MSEKDLITKMQEGLEKILEQPYTSAQALEYAKKMRQKADYAYHNSSEPLLSDNSYDKLVDWIEAAGKAQGKSIEKIGSVVPKTSPFAKVKHPVPIASLNKSKVAAELAQYFDKLFSESNTVAPKKLVLMPKLDGLTIVTRYDNGRLTQAVTRGDGEIGEDVTHTAMNIKSIPKQLKHPALQGTCYFRGEAVISKANFAPYAQEFKNPRNLVAGVIRTKDASKAARFEVDYILFNCIREKTVTSTGEDINKIFGNRFYTMLALLKNEGFMTVDNFLCEPSTLEKAIEQFSAGVPSYPIQLDGIVIQVDHLGFAKKLEDSRTGSSNNPKAARAFKWADTEHRTKVAGVIWSVARTGTITPVIKLEPVEIEGSVVKQASVHNLSIMQGLKLGIGDEVSVFKANMIIPQIAENFTKSGNLPIPQQCPVCHGMTRIRQSERAQILECVNPYCPVKNTKSLDHFGQVLDIIGLGGKTIEALVGTTPPILTDFASIYRLHSQKTRCLEEAGLGPKIYSNLVEAIEKTRGTRLDKVLAAFGIPGLGNGTAQRICKVINNDPIKFLQLTYNQLVVIPDIGPKTAQGIYDYLLNNRFGLTEVLKEIYKNGMAPTASTRSPLTSGSAGQGSQKLAGKSFAITGSLETFKNRKQLEELIEANGGENGAVKKGLSFLINNDSASQSSKNKKAAELGIRVITEQDFLEMIK